MRKLLLSLSVALSLLAFNSCTKDNIETFESQPTLATFSDPAVITIYRFTWDEWGKKARDCKGAGLCNFRLEEVEIRIPIRSFSANVEKRDDRLLVDIAANEELIFEDDSRKLYIDEDIYTTSHDDRTFRLPAGEYEFIESIGESGGYRLELFEL